MNNELYYKIIKIIKEVGVRHKKKHGDFYIIQKDNDYLALDTWNGYVNFIKGKFEGDETFDKGICLARDYTDYRSEKITKYNAGLIYKYIIC